MTDQNDHPLVQHLAREAHALQKVKPEWFDDPARGEAAISAIRKFVVKTYSYPAGIAAGPILDHRFCLMALDAAKARGVTIEAASPAKTAADEKAAREKRQGTLKKNLAGARGSADKAHAIADMLNSEERRAAGR